MKHLRSDYDDFAVLDAKIPDDEPVFLLRGQDPSSEAAVRAWAYDVERRNGSPELVRQVHAWSEKMGKYARSKGKAVADTPAENLRKEV